MDLVRIVVDVHEVGSGVVEALAGLGVDVETSRLPAGDYAIAPSWLVERKTVRDLHGSVIAGRFWGQIGKIRAASRRPCLLIEGADLDQGELRQNAVRGICVTALDLGVAIVWSRSAVDSAVWLHRLAVRAQNRTKGRSLRPAYDQKPNSAGDQVAAAVLAAVPGISTSLAGVLLERFGTVAGVVGAGPEEWTSVRGIGAARAAALRAALHSASRP